MGTKLFKVENMPSFNDNKTILESFKKNLKKVPLSARGQALAICNLLQKFLNEEALIDKKIEGVNKDFEKQQWTITSAMDEIIDGTRKLTDDELKAVDEFLTEGQTVTDDMNDQKKIENYWLTVFENAKIPIKEADKPIIKCLKKVDIRSEHKTEEPNKPKVMTLKLIFEENEFFEGTELTTVLKFEGYEEIKSSEGGDIKWKPGKKVMIKLKTKKSKKDNKKNIKK